MSEVKTKNSPVIEASKPLAWLLIVGGILGWVAAFLLTLERFHVAADPNATLSCDVATFISCKSVMLSPEAKLFGFPNPLIGLGAFIAPIVVGVAVLAGAKFAAWFWRTFLFGNLLAFVFVMWLFSEAVFDIGALCPYCMIAWLAVIAMFWQLLLHGTREGYIPVPLKSVAFFVQAYDWAWLLALVNLVAIAATIAVHFWTLWVQFFGLN